MRNGKRLKAVVPGGASVPILRAEDIEGVTMNGESLIRAGVPDSNPNPIPGRDGSMLGTAGMLVLDEDTDMVKFIYRVARFYDHESCGQCTPCREGTGWVRRLLERFVHHEAGPRDLDLLLDICDNMEGRTVCALADATAWPVRAAIHRFRDEFEARVKLKAVPVYA
jgi:NADH-quinone oxidoreductase subunit F